MEDPKKILFRHMCLGEIFILSVSKAIFDLNGRSRSSPLLIKLESNTIWITYLLTYFLINWPTKFLLLWSHFVFHTHFHFFNIHITYYFQMISLHICFTRFFTNQPEFQEIETKVVQQRYGILTFEFVTKSKKNSKKSRNC